MSKAMSLGVVIGATLGTTFSSAFGKAERTTLQLGKSLRDTDAKLKTVRGIRDYENQLEKLRAEQSQSGGSNKALAKEISRTEKELLRAQKAAEKYGISLDKLGDEEKRLAKEQQKNKLRELGGRVGSTVGSGIGMAGRVAGAALTAGVGVAGGALAIGKEFAGNAEALVNTANKLGYTTQAYQELQLAAAAAGIDQEKFNTSSEKMVTEISRVAATGKGAAAPALDELGLSAAKLAQMSPDQQMQAISDALGNVAKADDKLRLTKGIFGKSGGDMVNVLGGNLGKMREEVRKTGAVLSDQQLADGLKLDDALDRAELSMKGLTNTLGAALVPAMTQLIEKTSAFATEHGPQIQALGEVLGTTFSVVGTVLGGVFSTLESIGTSIGETLGWIESKSGLISGIADFFSGDDASQPATAGAGGGAPADVFPPVPKPTLGSSNKSSKTTVNAPITINQQPGQSSKDVADEVAKKLKQQQDVARRGALYDDEEPD